MAADDEEVALTFRTSVGQPLRIRVPLSATCLELRGKYITEVPPEIGLLTSLQKLDLYNNQLSALPPEIGLLANLTTLNLQGNQLSTLPPEIGKLFDLKTLKLSDNIKIVLPPEIGLLANLTTLNLQGNQLSALPPEIGQLFNLKTLSLNYNQFTMLPREIGLLTNLKTLNLYGNQLVTLPPEIGQLVHLIELFLDSNPFTDDARLKALADRGGDVSKEVLALFPFLRCDHNFQKSFVRGKCEVCGEKFKGLIKKGMVCSKCGGVVHEGCAESAIERRGKEAAEEERRQALAQQTRVRAAANDEARRKAIAKEEEQRKAAKEEARRKAEEEKEARLKAEKEEEARQKAEKEEEARRKAQRKAEKEARRKEATEYEAHRKAEQLKALAPASPPTKQSSVVDVCRWLGSIGLGALEQAFTKNEIDGSVLFDLSETDLEKMGIVVGRKKKLLSALRDIQAPQSALVTASPVVIAASSIPDSRAAAAAAAATGGSALPQQRRAKFVAPESESVTYKGLLELPDSYKPQGTCAQELLAARAVLGSKVPQLELIVKEVGSVSWSILAGQTAQELVKTHGLTEQEVFAIAAYTYDLGLSGVQSENLYFQLNELLRRRVQHEMRAVMGFLYFILGALRKLPAFEGTVFRGNNSPGMVASEYTTGREIFWSGFTSTTTDLAAALDFAGRDGVVFRIKINSGRSIAVLSVMQRENEVLLPPNACLMVFSEMHREADGVQYVDLVEKKDSFRW